MKAITDSRFPRKKSFLRLIVPILFFVSFQALTAQSPGGVSSAPELWLKADEGFTYNSTTNAEWLDQSSNSFIFNANLVQGPDTDSAPNLDANALNFNPGIVFDGIDNGLATAVDVADFNFSEVTVFSIQQVIAENTTTTNTVWHYGADGANDMAHFAFPTGYGVHLSIDGPNTISAPNSVLDDDLPYLFGVTSNASTTELYVNDEVIATDIGMNTLPGNGAILIGLDADTAEAQDGDNHLEGVIGEVLIFDSKLSVTDRQQVQSYLALKYGISLKQSSATDYIASDGSTIFWAASQNIGYSSDIFGIGRDDASGLNQKVSKSINNNSILTFALDADFTAANNDAARTTGHDNDNQFLMVANNGETTGIQFTEIDGVTYNVRTAREWKVDATNFTQNVSLKFEGFDETWSIIATTNGDFSSGVTTIGNLNTNGEFTTTTPVTDGVVITLAKLLNVAPGGVTANLQLWLSADNMGAAYSDGQTVSTWINAVSGGGDFGTPINTPSYEDDPSNLFNFNPVVYFGGDDYLRNDDSNFGLTGLGADVFSVTSAMKGIPGSSYNVHGIFAPNEVSPAGGLEYGFIEAVPKGIRLKRFNGPNMFRENTSIDIPYISNASRNEGTGVASLSRNGLRTSYGALDTDNWNSSSRYYLGAIHNNGLLNANLPELIVYNRELTAQERVKVQSYLAIKYGFSLDQTTVNDYVASNDTVIWDASDNTGYDNDISGIGRDDTSNLNQKVSKSINANSILTFALDADFTAANTDAARTASHTNDVQFLTIANNGASTTTQATELDAATGFNIRIAREWKVDKTTNFTQNISLKFEGYDENWGIIAKAGGDFSSGVSNLGSLNSNGEFTTSTPLTDGTTLTLAKLQEAPGGVLANNLLWLKADQGIYSDRNGTAPGTTLAIEGDDIESWKDASGTENTFYQDAGAGHEPNFRENAAGLNFNPGVSFEADDDDLLSNLIVNSTPYTFYVIYTLDQIAPGVDRTLSGLSTNWLIGPYNGQDRHFAGNWVTSPGPTTPIDQARLTMAANTGTASSFFVNGLDETDSSVPVTAPGQLILGKRGSVPESHDGDVAEVLYYDRILTATEKQQIDSYLSLKYGITLDQTTATDYVASDGTTILWDASDNTGYTTDIFAIGRDDKSSLNQKISKSVNTDALLTIAIDTDFVAPNTNSSRSTNHINDLQFLVIANNGATNAVQYTEIDLSEYTTRIGREWKVDKTANFTQTTNLKFDGFDETWTLIKDDDGDFSSGINTVGALNANGELTGVSLEDGDYITLAKFQEAPGGVIPDLALWLKADTGVTNSGNTVTGWQDQTANNTFTVSGTPTTNTSTVNLNNTIAFDGAGDFLTGNTAINFKNGYAVYKLNNTGNSTLLSATVEFNGNTGYFFKGPNLITGDNAADGGQTYLTTDGDMGTNFRIASMDIIDGQPVTSTTAFIDGEPLVTSLFVGSGNMGVHNSVPFMGRSQNDASADYLNGEVAEIIMYSSSHTSIQRNQIESYLALKYGIALDQSIPKDYLASSGAVIWSMANNTGYTADVFGIGRDNASGLNQKISKSINNANAPILATTQNFTATNQDIVRTTSLNNGDFVVMAHNNGTAATFNASYNGGTNNRSARIWKVDETGTVATIYMAIPKAAYTFPSGIPVIILSDDTTFDSTDTVVNLSDDGTYYWASINPADADYIAFASTTPDFSVSETALTIDENAGEETFTVVLAVEPLSDVVFAVTSSDTDEGTVDLATLTFTTANWDTPQTVTVTGVDDNDTGNDTATITVAINDAGSDDNFDALADKTVSATFTDDEIGVAATGTEISTADGTATANNTDTETITVQLKNNVGDDLAYENVEVTFSVTGNAVLSSATATTDANGTATVTITNTIAEVVDVTATVNNDSDDGTTPEVAISNGSPAQVTFETSGTIDDGASGTEITAADGSATSNGTETETIAIQLRDEFGNTIETAGIDLTFSATGSAVLSSATATTNASGIATVTVTNTIEETVSLTATGDFDSDGGTAQTAISNGSPVFVVFSTSGTKTFLLDAIADANVNENTAYTGPTPNSNGNPVGDITYTLGGTDAMDFSIVSTTGVVSMVARDFENPEDADTDNVYEVTITATDEDNNTDSEDWMVTVDNMTETVTFTIDTIDDVNVNENSAYTGVTPSLSGDTPIGDVTYALAGIDADDFSIDTTTGVVSMVAKDFENPTDSNTNSIYLASIVATDDDGNTAALSWDVTVTDVTETVSFTIDAIADIDVNENSAYTSVTPNLSGDTPVGTIAYSLAGIDSDDFTIDTATGVVSMVAKDFENPTDSNTNSIYLASIVATDADGNTAAISWDVTVTDVVESVSFTIDPIANETIDEETPYAGPIPSISGTPVGDVLYSVGGADAAIFSIDNATGQVFMLLRSFENPDDVNGDNTYEVTITATDQDDNSASEDWTVTLLDVTETASFSIDAIANASVLENSDYTGIAPSISGSPIGTVTYSLESLDAVSFTINGSTGVVSMVARDFENPMDGNMDNIYEVTITATDDDDNTASTSWSLKIQDFDESAVDTDGDGTPDGEDAFPNDPNEDTDTDGDGIGDNADMDDDGDGTPDTEDAFPLDENEDTDTDGDGTGDNADTDDDGDGTPDTDDDFPLDADEDTDTDGDGTGDNADTDDDNDGTPDTEDAFPTDPEEDSDIDGDGLGDNADLDDDNNGIDDADEIAAESEPLLIPAEAFTPNGDGINDTWMVPGIDNYPNAKVTVYNRWGHEVFAAINYRNDWQGNSGSNSEILPSGSYLYVIDLGNGTAPMKGWIFINY